MSNSFGSYGNGYGGGFENGYGFNSITGSNANIMEGVFGALLGVLIVFLLIGLAITVVTYIFRSVALYTIAKRRMIKNPWLAWLPIGTEWILGSISDQYQYVAKGKICNRRKILLGLSIAAVVLSVLYEILSALQTLQLFGDGFSVGFGMLAVVMLLLGLAMFGVGVASIVFTYIALYDLYQSCDPSNGLLYLLLSIFLSITMPFVMFVCRKLDRGMPPRKEEVQALPEETVEVVAEPVAEEAQPVAPTDAESAEEIAPEE